MKSIKKLLTSLYILAPIRKKEESSYEIVTPLVMDIITAKTIYNDLYKTFYSVSKKEYGNIYSLLRKCLRENLNGKDMQKMIKNSLQNDPELLTIIDQAFSIDVKKISSEEVLVLFRIFESKARRKYQEYTLKLNSLVSIFFFYIFLVPTPIILISEFLPQTSYILLPIFFISNTLIFRIFFNKIRRIKSELLG
ncbi:MAG: hypothetical protein FGF52_00155 [Candidatus Brockarchaeota archaeon]|nr:hypothetical protein [Candidatus Brockarchaeota archaeon]